MALEPIETPTRAPIPREGKIRRCRVRHVAIVPAPHGRLVQVTCLLGSADHPLPLGTMEEAREICNACIATTVWRTDED